MNTRKIYLQTLSFTPGVMAKTAYRQTDYPIKIRRTCKLALFVAALLLEIPLLNANAQVGLPPQGAVGTVLAKLSTQNGHTFIFGRSVRGDIVVAEGATVGVKPTLDASVTGTSVSRLYTELSGGVEAPEVLKAAEEAAKSIGAAGLIVSSAAPPKLTERVAPGFIFPPIVISSLTPNQQWFQAKFCSLPYISFCDLQNGSVNTSLYEWIYAPNYYAYGLNDSSNRRAANMYEWVWNGSSWQFDWASPAIEPGTYWYEWWWNTNPVYRATDLVFPDSGPTGFGSGGITPSGLEVSYPIPPSQTFNFNVGGAAFNTQFPNDAEVTCYVSGIRVTTFSTSLTGINVGVGGVCEEQQWYNSNPQAAWCQGNTTGQSVSTSVVAPYFAPANCCRSMGGTAPC